MPKSSSERPGTPPVFISHAALDKALVNAFVDTILIKGIGIPREAIFNTSATSSPIPPGSNFSESIRAALQGAQHIVALITPNYQERAFAMAELGAAWAFGKLIPILIPPIDFETTAGILKGAQCLKINDKINLSSLYDQFTRATKTRKLWFSPAGHGNFEEQRDIFLSELLPKQLKDLRTTNLPSTALPAKAAPAEALSYKSLKEENRRFQELTSTLRDALAKVPLIARVAFMHEAVDRRLLVSPRNEKDAINAAQRGYISRSKSTSVREPEESITPTRTTQQNRDIYNSMGDLITFLKTASPEFHHDFEESQGYAANLGLLIFWAKQTLLSETNTKILGKIWN